MKISWGVLLLLITAGAFAAEDPALMAADRSIFQALFGDLYRAATGEIDFQDIQDSAMSNLFKVYNLWALGVLAWAAFILLNTGVFASGVNGKVFADRYSPWSTVRMGLVVLALMPVFNGWSGAQVMVATGVSVGNKLANEANEKMARFTFSEGRVDEPTPRKYAVRQVVEQIISSEMCMAMVNHKLDLIELQHIRQIKILEDKKENSWVLQDFIDKYRRKTEISTKNDVYANRVSMVRTEDEASAINLGIMTLDGTHDFSLSWGSEKAGDSACGKIDFQLDSGKFDDHDRQRLFAKQYWSAQIQAIEAVQREIRGKVESANAEIKPLTGLVFIETGYEQTVELTNPLVAPLLDGLNQGVGKKEFLSIDATVGGLNGVVSSSVETYMAALKAALEAQSEDAEIAYDHLRKIAEQAQQDFLEGNISAQELKELELPALVSNDVKGWMFAGFRWWDITREQLNANNLEKLYPGTESLDAGDFDGGLDKNVQSLDESFKRLIARRKASDQLAVDGEMSAEFLQKLSAENDENVLGFVAKYNNIFSTWLTSSLFKTLFDIEDKNFLDAVQDTGHSLTATSEILIGTILGLDIAHKAVSASGPVGAAVGFLTDGVKDEVKSTLWTVALILGV
ncbi:MAG: hypothetical protein CL693_22035, partial [Cellvibrionaceae bacterium]|nr:hypothetical protein [Cellvibrionaceae bacterium]